MRDRSLLHAYIASIAAAILLVLILAAIRLSGVAFISWIGIILPIIIVNFIYCLIFVVGLSVFCLQDIVEKRKSKWITKDLKEYFQ